MEALCPVRAQASSSSSLFVFRLSSMADNRTTLEETSKNGFTQPTDDENNGADNRQNVSDNNQEDLHTDREYDAGYSPGYSGNTSVGTKAPDSDTVHTHVRLRKPKRKGLKRPATCTKSKKRKATMPPKSRTPRKRKRENSSSSSSSSDSDSSSSSCSDSDSQSSSSSQTWKMTKTEDMNAWKLPKKLAKSFARNLQEHYTDAELKDNILEECPPPKNIPPTPSLDSTTETYLGEVKATYAIANDNALARLSSKIRDITGPLSRVWDMCHRGKMNKIKSKMAKEKLDQSMVLISQAMSAITFHRRRAVLTSIAKNRDRAHRWVKDKYRTQLVGSTKELFGSEFHKSVQKDARSVELSTIRYMQMQAKGKSMPFRKGSTARQRQPSSTVEHGKAAQTSTRGSRGKSSKTNPHFQHNAETSESSKHTPSHTGTAKPIKKVPPNGGETEAFSPTMGKAHKRPMYSRLDKGLQNSTAGNTLPIKNSEQIRHNRRTRCNSIERGVQHVGNGCDSEGKSHKGGNHKQCLHKGEKRKRSVQADSKPKATKLLYTPRKVQNGNIKKCERSTATRRSHDKNRSKTCILLGEHCTREQEVPQIHLERNSVRVHLSCVRLGTGAQGIYETVKSSHNYSAENKHQNSDIHRRHV